MSLKIDFENQILVILDPTYSTHRKLYQKGVLWDQFSLNPELCIPLSDNIYFTWYLQVMTYHDALMNQLTTLVAHVRKLRSRLQQVIIFFLQRLDHTKIALIKVIFAKMVWEKKMNFINKTQSQKETISTFEAITHWLKKTTRLNGIALWKYWRP